MNKEVELFIEDIKRIVSPVPERRALELFSTFIAATTKALEDVVSEDVVSGVLTSIARMMAKEMWPSLGEPKGLNELLKAIMERFPAKFEKYVTDDSIVVRTCPIRDIVERENLKLGGMLCTFTKGFFWYMLQKAVDPKAKIVRMAPGYYGCLCTFKNVKVEDVPKYEYSYEEYLEKVQTYMEVLLKGLLSTFQKLLGDVAKGYLVNAGRFAGYAHGSIFPLVEDPSLAIKMVNAYLTLWEGEVKLGEGAWILEEKKYEIPYIKDEMFCNLFYGYISGLLSAALGKDVQFDNYGCSEKKVMKLE